MRRKKIIRWIILLVSVALLWYFMHDKRGDLIEINSSSLQHESYAHQKTWLSFHAQESDSVKKNLILIAGTIASFEPVSILVSKTDTKELKKLLGSLNTYHYPVEMVESDINTTWLRNIAPTFVFTQEGDKGGINFHFNSQEKEYTGFSSQNIDSITTQAKAKVIHSNLKLKGGCFEVDGSGTAIMTESCIINDELNPYWEKEEIETELKMLLGLQKIIWLKGSKAHETQTDLYVRFVKEGIVLVHRNNDSTSYEFELTRENIKILQEATDAKGNALEIVIIDAPKNFKPNSHTDDFAGGYLGYYICNRAVIMQSFGDEEADYRASKILQLAFPERTIEQIQIDAISSAKGSIHKVTLQEPAL